MTAEPAQRAAWPRRTRHYAADWALFTDWCDVTGTRPLPADPATVLAFLADCPAAPATQRRRVTAIDHHHTAAGHPPPGRRPAGPGRARPATDRAPPSPPEIRSRVEAALRALPSRGWTAACSAGGTAACSCCPNSPGSRTSTWPH